MRIVRRHGFSRPWPEGEPTRPGVRCPLSDLLPEECACKNHAKKEPPSEPGPAEPFDFDFS